MNAPNNAAQYFDRYDGYFTPDFPELGSGSLPTTPYVSPEYFELERNKIFRKSWFKIGHESQIPENGDFFVKEVPIIKSSIIVVRGKDKVIRGFHNVCSHRGNQLVQNCSAGKKTLFVCPFHSWSFDQEGKLRGVPERDRFVDFDPAKFSLTSVSVEVWKGFIFMNPSPTPEQGFVDYLGTLGADLDSYPFERLRLAASWSADIKANWKTVIDPFQEAYHVATVHREVAPSMYKVARTGHNRVTGFRTHGNHRSFAAAKNTDFVPSGIEATAFGMCAASLMRGIPDGRQLWPGINLRDEPAQTWAFDVNVIFPSTFIDVSQGYCFTYEFYPSAVDQTRFEAKMYIAKPESWSERLGQEFLLIQLREALLEDLRTFEGVQRGLSSDAIKLLTFSDQEIACRHAYHAVDSIVKAP